MRISEDEYTELINRLRPHKTAKPKKAKYHNKKITMDGIKFDSKKESDYYSNLQLLLKAKEIQGFCRQPRFKLVGCEYVADFIVWHNSGLAEVIDVKGVRTDVYKVKIKQFRELYPDLKFREVSQ